MELRKSSCMNMRVKTVNRALFPGSFDPLTNGHLALIERYQSLFSEVVIGIMTNHNKKALLTASERKQLIEENIQQWPNVRVEVFENQMTVQAAQAIEADVLIRGLRDVKDYVYEQELAQLNREQTGIETLFLQADPKQHIVSSSAVKEIRHFGGDYQQYVPANVWQLLQQKEGERNE